MSRRIKCPRALARLAAEIDARVEMHEADGKHEAFVFVRPSKEASIYASITGGRAVIGELYTDVTNTQRARARAEDLMSDDLDGEITRLVAVEVVRLVARRAAGRGLPVARRVTEVSS